MHTHWPNSYDFNDFDDSVMTLMTPTTPTTPTISDDSNDNDDSYSNKTGLFYNIALSLELRGGRTNVDHALSMSAN